MFLPAFSFQTNSKPLVSIRVCISAYLLIACAVFGSAVPRRTHAQVPSDDDEVLKVSTDLLLFPIRVRNQHPGSFTALTEKDLILKDPERVTNGLYFLQGIDRVALVFALDQSGSTRETISLQRDAALALFSRFGERSKIAVIRFAQTPVMVLPFGRDVRAAREAFDFSSAPNEHTAIFDAASAALQAFDELPPVRSERRIVILISDGLDNASSVKASSVIEAASRKRVSFYVIHVPLFEPRDGRLAVRPPSKGFKELAEQTSGKYFLAARGDALSPNRRVDLMSTFTAIEEDLRSQYLLGFYLNDQANDGRKHRFSLSLPPGFQYQVGQPRYARTHEFFVNRPRQALKSPN